jgi:hypothetical protein
LSDMDAQIAAFIIITSSLFNPFRPVQLKFRKRY